MFVVFLLQQPKLTETPALWQIHLKSFAFSSLAGLSSAMSTAQLLVTIQVSYRRFSLTCWESHLCHPAGPSL